MLSLISSESSSIVSSTGDSFLVGLNRGPLLIAGRENPRRPRTPDHDHRQLLRLTGFKDEDIDLIRVLFDLYDRNRDGMLEVEEACQLCTTLGFHPADSSTIRCNDDGRVEFRQLVQSLGLVKSANIPPPARGGNAKHFFRMANRCASTPMEPEQLHSFFQSMGVDIPLPAVERIMTSISRNGESRFTEDELMRHVARIQGRQNTFTVKKGSHNADAAHRS